MIHLIAVAERSGVVNDQIPPNCVCFRRSQLEADSDRSQPWIGKDFAFLNGTACALLHLANSIACRSFSDIL